MKLLFKLLLAANVVFFLAIWFYPMQPATEKQLLIPDSKKMILLTELGQEIPAIELEPDQIEAEITPEQTSLQLPETEEVDPILCYTLGPFKKESLANQVTNQSAEQAISMQIRKSTEREYMGLLVYLSGHENRKQVQATARDLSSKGIKDFIVINEEDKPNSLSLGVFGLKKNATRRINLISKLGYKPLTEARYRQRDIYWLDYKTDNQQKILELLTAELKTKGVSQISRQCPG